MDNDRQRSKTETINRKVIVRVLSTRMRVEQTW